MGIGMATGDHRAVEAAQNAVSSQLLETSINGATRVLVNVTSGNDLTLAEFNEAAEQIASLCDQRDANIIFGWVPDQMLEGEVRVTVLATGFNAREDTGTTQPTRPITTTRPFAPTQPVVGNTPPTATPRPTDPPATPPGQEKTAQVQPPVPPDPRKDDLDIPAFLRKR
ncbi:MAG: cell division protein FtsZ [Chthonomonadales bacterium]|nr:cell division protein FtsZ [Chthonomonadales bacterium]